MITTTWSQQLRETGEEAVPRLEDDLLAGRPWTRALPALLGEAASTMSPKRPYTVSTPTASGLKHHRRTGAAKVMRAQDSVLSSERSHGSKILRSAGSELPRKATPHMTPLPWQDLRDLLANVQSVNLADETPTASNAMKKYGLSPMKSEQGKRTPAATPWAQTTSRHFDAPGSFYRLSSHSSLWSDCGDPVVSPRSTCSRIAADNKNSNRICKAIEEVPSSKSTSLHNSSMRCNISRKGTSPFSPAESIGSDNNISGLGQEATVLTGMDARSDDEIRIIGENVPDLSCLPIELLELVALEQIDATDKACKLEVADSFLQTSKACSGVDENPQVLEDVYTTCGSPCEVVDSSNKLMPGEPVKVKRSSSNRKSVVRAPSLSIESPQEKALREAMELKRKSALADSALCPDSPKFILPDSLAGDGELSAKDASEDVRSKGLEANRLATPRTPARSKQNSVCMSATLSESIEIECAAESAPEHERKSLRDRPRFRSHSLLSTNSTTSRRSTIKSQFGTPRGSVIAGLTSPRTSQVSVKRKSRASQVEASGVSDEGDPAIQEEDVAEEGRVAARSSVKEAVDSATQGSGGEEPLKSVRATLTETASPILVDVFENKKKAILEKQPWKREAYEKVSFDLMLNLHSKFKKFNLDLWDVILRWEEFAELDESGNGLLSIDEFKGGLRKQFLLPAGPVPRHLLDKHWERILSFEGVVDFPAYLEWSVQHAFTEEVLVPNQSERRIRQLARELGIALTKVENIKKVYDRFDTNGSGLIDREEFTRVMEVLMKVKNPGDLSEKMLDRYWHEVDSNFSGQVDFQEFVHWYTMYFDQDQ